MAKAIKQPLHLGITEAGGRACRCGKKCGRFRDAFSAEGIGDTLRVSLATDPGREEIKVGFDILKSRIRSHGINFIACPTCSSGSLM